MAIRISSRGCNLLLMQLAARISRRPRLELFTIYTQKLTLPGECPMSALCQKRTFLLQFPGERLAMMLTTLNVITTSLA